MSNRECIVCGSRYGMPHKQICPRYVYPSPDEVYSLNQRIKELEEALIDRAAMHGQAQAQLERLVDRYAALVSACEEWAGRMPTVVADALAALKEDV